MLPIFHSLGQTSCLQRHENQVTAMLLSITFSFLVLFAWQCISQCFWMTQHGITDGVPTVVWEIVDNSFAAAKLGAVINASLNCVLYYCTGCIFRREVAKIFLRMRKNRAKVDNLNSSPK